MVDAGVANKGRRFWIFGSATGTRPGVTLASAVGNAHLPLNADPYTDITIAFANAGPFSNTLACWTAAARPRQIKAGH